MRFSNRRSRYRIFEVDQKTQGTLPMVYAPQGQSGNFFNRQERNVRSLQFVEALTYSKDQWAGQHVFKFGVDLQHSRLRRRQLTARSSTWCGSTARWPSAPRTLRLLTNPEVSGTEFAFFAQDRWRVNDRLMFELGIRSDRDDVVEKVNFSPRAGMSVSLLPRGSRDPAGRVREVCGAHAADGRGVHAV